MKTFKKIISFIIFLFCFISLVSCGFVDGDGGKAIKSIESMVENGETKLVITYEDETIKPDIFTLPVGKEGVGIQTVIVTDKLDGTGKTISIHMTDGREPEIFELTNGVSVTGVTSEIDKKTGNTLVYVNYSNGTKSDPIVIQKGNGFTGIDKVEHPDGSQDVTIHFGDKDALIKIPAGTPGPEGRGIQSIASIVEGEEYIFRVTYTDGNKEDIKFPKPVDPATWLSGQSPSDKEGKDGDFFFDTVALKIYRKEQGKWTLIANLAVDIGECRVRFELNSPKDAEAKMPFGASTEYTVKKFTYFTDKENGHGSIPIPSCPGYIFRGWYNNFGNNVNETTGKFTDLTPVLSDLTLYAKWEKTI